MRCWQTAEAESLIALGFLMIGFILIVTKSEKIKTITDLAAMAISAMGVMIPLKWIGGCMNPLMPCHTIGFPLTYGICATVFFAAAVGLAVQLKKFVKPSLTTVCETEK